MAKLSDITGIVPSKRTYRPSDEFACPSTFVGIELELEQVNHRELDICKSFWKTTEDGSLRNNGIEFISEPIFGDDINMALSALEEQLDKISYNISHRCGLHIHVDVSDFTTNQLISFTCWYAIMEKVLFKMVGEERAANIYCLPITETDILYEYYSGIKYNEVPDSVRKEIKQTYKYSAFNILPILTQGSIEFRHAAATDDMGVIKDWIKLILAIRHVAKEYPILDYVNSPIKEMKAIILGNVDLLNYPGIDRELLAGWVIAKDILNFTELENWWNKNKEIYKDVDNITK